MTQSQQVLISLLKKSLFNFEAQLPNNVDWQEVFEEAKFQSVIPFVYDATSGIEGIPTEVLKQFKSNTIAIMFNNDKVVKAQSEICKLLEDNKISYCILKGLSVARYYNKPELRTLGDVDILVSKDEFEKAKSVFLENVYTLTEEENNYHCAFRKNDVTLELHFSMSSFPETEVGDKLKQTLENATDSIVKTTSAGVEFYSLDNLYQAVSLLLHIERHLIADGIGLRQLLDFGVFVKENPGFLSDEENIDFLKRFGLYKLAVACVDVIDKFFFDKQIECKTANELLELSLKKGNFGVKRSKEETYSNFDVENKSKFAFVNYFKYFKKRAKYNWPLAKKYPWLCNLGFIYLPIRHVFRVVFKKQKVDYKKVLKSNNEVYSLYNDLSIFKR